MGCDITLFCERYNEESKRWDFLSLYKKKEDGGFEPVSIYNGRDYELFGLLAGVRGASSFFGNRYGYLVEPRGLPDDVSVAVQKAWEEGKDGDDIQWRYHTPTWYDFCELENYSHLLNDFDSVIEEKNKHIKELEKEIELLKGEDKERDSSICFEDDDNVFKRLDSLVRDITDLLYKYDIYSASPGQIRLVMWFDS